MNASVKPSRLGLNYGVLLGLIMSSVFMLQQFLPFITPSILSYINIVLLTGGLIAVPVIFKRQNEGYMSFGQGLGSNSILILMSTVISSVLIYVYVKFIDDYYLAMIKEERLNVLKAKMPESQAEQLIENSGQFFNAEFIMIPLVISKFVIGFVLALIIVAILMKKRAELE